MISDIPLRLQAIHPLTNQILPVIVSKMFDWDEFTDIKLGMFVIKRFMSWKPYILL